MQKKIIIITALSLTAILLFAKFAMMKSSNESLTPEQIIKKDFKSIPLIEWETLDAYDYNTGEGPKELKELDGKLVRIPGYVVPLSHNVNKLDEFLLVPDAQSCVHVPPPPPNLIISATLRKAIPIDEVTYPTWLIGIFKIEKSESQYGGAAFKLDTIRLKEFKMEDWQ